MDRIDRYILSHLAGPFFAALLGALALLSLERMLRLLDYVGKSKNAIAYVFDMLANLIPHYLGIALPAALFIACYVGYRRLAQTSELAAFASLGRGLARLTVPVMVAALLLTAISAYVHSNMQPYGRYAYRQLGFLAANASIAAAVESGAFVELGEITFTAEKAEDEPSGLARVFVHEREDDGAIRTITSKGGALLDSPEAGRSQIDFTSGVMLAEGQDGDRSVIHFGGLSWPIQRGAFNDFRPRGATERELTWPELLVMRDSPPEGVTRDQLLAELHGRAAKTLTILLVPLLAIALAATGGRARSSWPLAFGGIAFLVHIQVLQFAEGLADLGKLDPILGIWGPFALSTVLVLWLFWRVWRGVGFEPSFAAIRLPRWRLGRVGATG